MNPTLTLDEAAALLGFRPGEFACLAEDGEVSLVQPAHLFHRQSLADGPCVRRARRSPLRDARALVEDFARLRAAEGPDVPEGYVQM